MDPNTPVGGTTLAKIEKASVKRILKDLAGTRPDLIRDALIAGLEAPPPRSFPYVALIAAYLDGKPIDAEPASEQTMDLSSLTREQLAERAARLVRLLKSSATEDEVIEATVIPDDPQQLQAAIRKAEEDVRLANEELERLRR